MCLSKLREAGKLGHPRDVPGESRQVLREKLLLLQVFMMSGSPPSFLRQMKRALARIRAWCLGKVPQIVHQSLQSKCTALCREDCQPLHSRFACKMF